MRCERWGQQGWWYFYSCYIIICIVWGANYKLYRQNRTKFSKFQHCNYFVKNGRHIYIILWSFFLTHYTNTLKFWQKWKKNYSQKVFRKMCLFIFEGGGEIKRIWDTCRIYTQAYIYVLLLLQYSYIEDGFHSKCMADAAGVNGEVEQIGTNNTEWNGMGCGEGQKTRASERII